MQQKRRNYTILIIAAVIVLAIGAFGFFYSHAREYLRSIANTELSDYATHNAYSTKSELEKAVQLTQTAGESFTSIDDLSSEAAFRKLRILAHDTPFEAMILCTLDGHGIDSSGGSIDSSKLPNFKRTTYGESHIATMDIDDDSELEIIVSAPIISDGKVTGTLHGIYQSFDLTKIINVNSFGGEGYAVLVESDGDIIVPDNSSVCLNKDDENYWTFFKRGSFDSSCTYTDLLQNIQDKKSGIAVYSYGNQQREMYYTPVGVKDWYLLQMVTSDVVNNYTTPMTRMVFLLIISLCALFVIISFAVHYQMEQSRKEKAIETERFRTLADNIPGGVAELLVNDGCLVEYANDGFFQLMGYTKEDFMHGWIEGHCLRILQNEDRNSLMERIHKQIQKSNRVSVEYQIKRSDGAVCWISMAGKVIRNRQNESLVQAIITDVTVQKQQTSEIMESAKLDKMTQLYDKVSVTEIITRELQLPQNGSVNALLILDIDNFKQVNDTYGHPLGDVAIIMIAETLKKTFRSTDIKGRIGGDEFIVLLRNVRSMENVTKLLATFQQKIRELELAGKVGALSCSIGGIVIPMIKIYAFDELFKQVDHNLYSAKNSQKGSSNITTYAYVTDTERRDF